MKSATLSYRWTLFRRLERTTSIVNAVGTAQRVVTDISELSLALRASDELFPSRIHPVVAVGPPGSLLDLTLQWRSNLAGHDSAERRDEFVWTPPKDGYGVEWSKEHEGEIAVE